MPSPDKIFGLMAAVFDAADLPASYAVISMIYVHRMLANTGIALQPVNWARSVLGAVILASKIWEDNAVWNVDFHQIFPEWPVNDINNLERWFMYTMKYNINVKPTHYTRAYFDLNDFVKNLDKSQNESRQLTIYDVKGLEAKSKERKEAKPLECIDLEAIAAHSTMYDYSQDMNNSSHNQDSQGGPLKKSQTTYIYASYQTPFHEGLPHDKLSNSPTKNRNLSDSSPVHSSLASNLPNVALQQESNTLIYKSIASKSQNQSHHHHHTPLTVNTKILSPNNSRKTGLVSSVHGKQITLPLNTLTFMQQAQGNLRRAFSDYLFQPGQTPANVM